MKRWILWSIAGVVVLLALGFAVTQVPSATPYRFLRGWTLAPVADGSGGLRPARSGDPMRVYTIKGDYDKLLAEASRELRAHGMRELRDKYGVSFMPAERTASLPRVSFARDHKTGRLMVMNTRTGGIALFTDYRLEKGWVTVMIEGERMPSWWDNFCAWLGF